MRTIDRTNYRLALEDFRRARRRATLEQMMARLPDRSADLLSYEEVRKKLRARGQGIRQLKDVPLDAITGSVGRYTDFTRSFLPKQDSDETRWAGVKSAMMSAVGLPPIEVYQIGEVYFVLDGNHRVSVARQIGATHIQAYVTPLHTRVSISPDIQPDDLIIKAEYADFLEHTRLDELRPDADLSFTNPGRYRELEEHIDVHRYFMGLDQNREIPYEEAVAHWYDEIYLPVVQVIRERGVLKEFPDRTEADLYIWLGKYRAELEHELGLPVDTEVAAADLAAKPESVATRVLEAVIPDGLESGSETGEWRIGRLEARHVSGTSDRMFSDILVPVSGEEDGWLALEQALVIARREGARLHGLHVLPSEDETGSDTALAVKTRFEARCEAVGLPGTLTVTVGRVPRQICKRSRWTDLVIVNLAFPPMPGPLAKLGSGFRTILRNCRRPVLAVPGAFTQLSRALLAYDGSAKAEEALFIAAYLACCWQVSLTVVTVIEKGRATPETLTHAREYLETRGVEATFVQVTSEVAQAILQAVEEHESDIILMGGYGRRPLAEAILGSTVDQLLRESRKPILICR